MPLFYVFNQSRSWAGGWHQLFLRGSVRPSTPFPPRSVGALCLACWVAVGLCSVPTQAARLAAIDGAEGTRPPEVIRTTHEEGSVHSANLPIELTLRHGSAPILSGSIQFLIDHGDVTSLAQVKSNSFGVTVMVHPRLTRNTSHNYEVRFVASDHPEVTLRYSVGFATDARGPGDRLIELEDYNFDGGKTRDKANEEDYKGGAFEGEKARLGVDYETEFPEPLVEVDNEYRPKEEPATTILAGTDIERSGFLLDANWLLLGQTHSWFQYSRTFPRGSYYVYAALSHGSLEYGSLSGRLMRWVSGESGQSSVQELGKFLANGSGAWGKNTLVPLRTSEEGEQVDLQLDGPTTFRYEFTSGAGDYLLFVPKVLLQRVSMQNGELVIEWLGEARVVQSVGLTTGSWTDLGPKTSPLRIQLEPSKPSQYYKLLPASTSTIED